MYLLHDERILTAISSCTKTLMPSKGKKKNNCVLKANYHERQIHFCRYECILYQIVLEELCRLLYKTHSKL